MAAALQNNCICAPKLGGRTSLTAVLRGPPAGVKARAQFQRCGAASTVGGCRAGSHVLGLIPFLSALNSKVRLFSKVFAKSLFRWLVSVRSLRLFHLI